MPTLNQKKAVKETLEKLGKGKKVSMGKILRKNGYSEAVVKNPKIVTESLGWKQLMEKHLPDTLLVKVHKEGLQAQRSTLKGMKPDYAVRHSYLETAYKIKSKLKEGDSDPKIFMPIQVIIGNDSIQANIQRNNGKLPKADRSDAPVVG